MGKGAQLSGENGDQTCTGEHEVGYTEAELLKKFYIYIQGTIYIYVYSVYIYMELV